MPCVITNMELDKHQQAMIKHLFKNGRMKKSEVYTVVPTGGNRARKLDGDLLHTISENTKIIQLL